ncbi:MAG TPA: hypothetical protein VI385_08300 [Flavisolibacter sp.]|jgi:hypothetical protein
MKRSLLEKGFVIVLFVLVMVAFSFAERDTQKAFEKFNVKSTVQTLAPKVDYTAEASERSTIHNKSARN